MKLTHGLATIAALASAADARQTAFQGCAPCAAASTRPSTALDMRRRRSPMMRSLMPSPRSLLAEMEQMDRLMERQFNDFFDSPILMRPTTPFLSRRADLMLPERAAVRRPYRYQISEDDEKFTLTIELPGVKASDMKVSLEQDGRVLRISGMRTVKNGEMSYESKFDKTFVLDKNVDVELIKANLSEGVMTIDAPKKPKVEPKSIEIPIHEEVPQIEETAAAAAATEEEIKVETGKKIDAEEKVEMKVEEEAKTGDEEEVVDLDKVEEKPKEEVKAEVPEEEEKEKKPDDLDEDAEFLI